MSPSSSRSDAAALDRVLVALGVDPASWLGGGGEANVYAVDGDRVARVHHRGATLHGVERRTALLSELDASAWALPFAIPFVLETHLVADRVVTVERRFWGRPLSRALAELCETERAPLVRAYLEAVARLGDLALSRPWYGELTSDQPLRAATFRGYLEQRARRSLALAPERFHSVDARQLANALPEPSAAAFVHLDAFPGNVLVAAGTVTAIVDFGSVAIAGDRRLDALSAAAYLAPPITPAATEADQRVARAWLRERGLEALYEPARRWLAAFWSFACDDPAVDAWCRSVFE